MSGSLWGNAPAGGGSSGASSGGFTNPFGGGSSGASSGSVIAPSAPTTAAPAAATGLDFNPLNPWQAASTAPDIVSGLFDNLKNSLFGTSQADAKGHHGGIDRKSTRLNSSHAT